MKIAIIVNEETMMRCSGGGCLKAFFTKSDSFQRYVDNELELVAFTHNGGDITKKIATLQSKGVDVVHLSSCLRAKYENYEAFAQQLAENFAVVGYTHGGESGKTRDSIILNKVSK
ncbi:MAG: CGGC domain-containing protein [Negativicutes bacterium]|nr:CGGC domain-containing protein [Negativicutes bacterium]MBP9949758.1 CGGC domain-containing protein [Negativicutes bacterium]